MNFRLFSKKHGLYTNSPFWPSNQRSFSEWFLSQNRNVIEAVGFDENKPSSFTLIGHDVRDFDIEPWTGYFDKHGKKIYRGDILKLWCFNLDYEVVWLHDRFSLRALYDTGNDEIYGFPTSTDSSTNYEVCGNIHNVEYND